MPLHFPRRRVGTVALVARTALLVFALTSISLADGPGENRAEGDEQVPPPFPRAEPVTPPTALARGASVQRPAAIKGVRGWSLETLAHRGPITIARFDPTGKYLATASLDGTVRLWTPDGKSLQHIFFGRGAPIDVIAFSPSGRFLAAGDRQGVLLVWDLTTWGRSQPAFFKGGLRGLCFTPDEKRLVLGNSEAALGRLTLATLKTDWSISYGDNRRFNAQSIAVSPNGEKIALGSPRGGIWILSIDNPRQNQPAKVAGNSVAWSADGSSLAGVYRSKINVASSSSKVIAKPWNAGIEGAFFYGSLDWCHRTGWLAAGSANHGILLAHPEIKEVRQIGTTGDGCPQVHWSPDGARLATGDKIWDVQQGKVFGPAGKSYGTHLPHRVVWLPDSRGLLVLDDATGVVRTTIASPDQSKSLACPTGRVAAVSPDGTLLAVGGAADGSIQLQSLVEDTAPRKLDGHQLAVTCLAWSRDGKQLCSGAFDARIVVWDVSNGKILRNVDLEARVPRELSCSADGRSLAIAGHDRRVDVVAIDGESTRQVAKGSSINFGQPVRFVRFAPKTDTLAIALGESTLEFWEVDPQRMTGRIDTTAAAKAESYQDPFGAEEPPRNPRQGRIVDMAWVDEDAMLTNDGNTIRYWTADRQQPRAIQRLPATGQLSPDTRRLAWADHQRIRFWNRDDGRPLGTRLTLSDGSTIAIAPSGHWRGPAEAAGHLVYVVRNDEAEQVLTAEQFEQQYGWKNDPSRVGRSR